MKKLLFILFSLLFIFSCQEENKVVTEEIDTSNVRTVSEFKKNVQLLKEKHGFDTDSSTSSVEELNIASEYNAHIDKSKKYDIVEEKEVEIEVKKEKVKKPVKKKYFTNNSLYTGAQPYAYCYGENLSCTPEQGYKECSSITVEAPTTSDVIVTIKKDKKVYVHAYIRSGETHTFKLADDVYQTFFYYGNGWDFDKVIKRSSCGVLKGGFLRDIIVSKDDPFTLFRSEVKYELTLNPDGNFKSIPSSITEAL